MKFYNFYRKFRYIVVLLLSVFITGTIIAQDDAVKNSTIINASLKLTDENGAPVPYAKVVIGEGVIQGATDENGGYSFKVYPNDYISVYAPGFESRVIPVQDILTNSTIKLKKAKLFMTIDDDISLPFMTLKKRYFSGGGSVIAGEQLEKYPSTDLRNALSGLVPGLQITEYDGSPGFSAEEKLGSYGITEKIGVQARGGKMIYIVDDIPTDITEIALDPQEIESVIVNKDIVGKTMFGPMGADGIVIIKTKRGKLNERVFSVNAESGINVVDRFPGWTTGTDYAMLNNLARQNDEMVSLYSEDDMEGYAKNDPNDLYHPNVNFREMMLKDTRSFTRANLSSRGGNEVVQYSAYLGYNGEGDIYKIGPKADYNRLTASSNVDIRINDEISVMVDIAANITLRRSPNYGYTETVGEGGAQMDLLEIRTALPQILNTPPNAFPVYANNDPSLKFPWFGVSSVYTANPIGNLISNGDYIETGRKGTGKFALNYDFSKVIEGLKSETFLGFDVLDLSRIGLAKDYIAYIATPSKTADGSDTILYSISHNGVVSSTLNNLHDYYYQRIQFFEKLNFHKSFGIHDIQSTLTYFLYNTTKNGIQEPQRQQNAVWSVNYSNNDKYIIQGVLNYAGTYSFEEAEKYKVFPAVGVSWIISEESFMSNMKYIDFLKLRAQAGILGYENFLSPYLYRDRWVAGGGAAFGPHTANRWFGNTPETAVRPIYPGRVGHSGLTWETRKEFTIGMDALLLKQKLSVEVNYYNNLHDGIITQLTNTVPYLAGISSALPSINYNTIRYYGLETGIQFADNSGRLKYSIGGNATIQNSKYEKFNEPDYRFEYQYLTGESVDAYRGLTYLGKFQSDPEALEVPQAFDAILKAGDLKYKDMNEDGFIDENDMSVIGHTTPRLIYALNAHLRYKNFEISAIGTGCAFYDLPLTNSYYWNGWGDNNYSNFVRDNIGGAYPRLTYYKVNNNFVNSNFWLVKGDYFKIQNVELALYISPDKLKIIHSRGARLFVRGANLLTISKVKDVDPESINSGVTTYPLYKTFTGGVKLTF